MTQTYNDNETVTISFDRFQRMGIADEYLEKSYQLMDWDDFVRGMAVKREDVVNAFLTAMRKYAEYKNCDFDIHVY